MLCVRSTNFSKINLFVTVLFLICFSYFYGVVTVQYKVFPFNQIRYVKNFIYPSNTNNSIKSPKYLHAKSFFEIHGIKADIVMVGDSITDGAEWHEMIRSHTIVNRGIGGDTTDGIINRISSIISTKAKKSFIMVGINDLNKGYSVEKVFSNYEGIVNELKLANIKPYIQSTIYAGERLSSLNESIISLNNKLKSLSEKEGIVYIDLNKELSTGGILNKKYTEDDVHLNGEGYLVWKKLISPYL